MHLETVHQQAMPSVFPTAKLSVGAFAVLQVKSEMHT